MPIHVGGAVLCVSLIAAGWCFGLGPLLAHSHASTSIDHQYDQAQQQARISKEQLKQLQTRLEDVKGRLAQQPVSLEPASAINPLLADLARWADERRLSMTRTQAGRPVALAYYDYVPISLAGEGSYPAMLGFLKTLHGARGDLGVVSFNATRMAGQGGVSFQIELAWYVVSGEGEPGAPATAAVNVE